MEGRGSATFYSILSKAGVGQEEFSYEPGIYFVISRRTSYKLQVYSNSTHHTTFTTNNSEFSSALKDYIPQSALAVKRCFVLTIAFPMWFC